jgi:PAS domain S-box-containing protein
VLERSLTIAESGIPVLVVQAAGALFLAAALFVAARAYRRPFLGAWARSAIALAVFAGVSATTAGMAAAGALPPVLAWAATGAALLGKYLQSAWLVVGTAQAVGGPTARPREAPMIAVSLAAAGATMAAAFVEPGFFLVGGISLAQAVCAIAFCYAAWTVFSLGRLRSGIGRWLLVGTFGLAAAEELRLALQLWLTASGIPVGPHWAWFGVAGLLLDAGVAGGAIALLLEEESAERAAAAASAESALTRLRESERHERLVLDHIDEVIFSFGLQPGSPGALRLSTLSGRVREILGCEPDHLLRDPSLFRARVHPDDQPRIDETWEHMATSRQVGWCEFRLRDPGTDDCRWVEERVTPQFGDEGTLVGVFGVARDVTDRKRAEAALRRSEEQVRQAQKMEAVGRLAGGIAHDFNNVLTVIAGHTDLLLDALPEDDPRRPDAVAVHKAADRATALVSQLLVFSRRQILRPRVLNLRELIQELHGMLNRLIGEDVRLTPAFDPSAGCIRADRTHIEQVVVNLVVNARDAMRDGGAVVIEVRDAGPRDEPVLERLGVPPGPYVVLAVHDTGTGIDPETRARLFEPFFTTKDPGKGTGLGLATVYGIVKQSGGAIDVRSEAGRGSSFSIYLPRVDAETEPQPIAPPRLATVGGLATSSVILVVEDEDAVRSFVVAALRSRGHTVLEAAGGDAALAISASYEGRIDLLLTDMVMPGMRGSELATRLLRLRPETRIAFMTGYTDDATWRVAQATGHIVLAKPFTADALAQAVREAVQATPTARPISRAAEGR